jgi:hypothetical protein
VHDLPNGPTVRAISRVELGVRSSVDERAEHRWRLLESLDVRAAACFIERRGQPRETADGITKLIESGHAGLLLIECAA